MIYQRKPTLAHAWRVPAWGEPADAPAPPWLVVRMQSGEVRINGVGGLSCQYVWGARGCGPGDFIILTETDEIEFCSGPDFSDLFEPALSV